MDRDFCAGLGKQQADNKSFKIDECNDKAVLVVNKHFGIGGYRSGEIEISWQDRCATRTKTS